MIDLEARRQGIGGSDIAAIAGLNPYRSPLAVYLNKRGEVEDQPDNERMLWGRKLEDVVARHFAEVNEVKVQRVNKMLVHPKYPHFFANLDRMVVKPRSVLEVKTGGAHGKQAWAEDSIPPYYELQLRWYLLVTGLKEGWLAALLGGQEYIERHVTRDKEIDDYLIQIALDFWKMVLDGTPPEPTAQDTDLIKAMHHHSEPISIVLPDDTSKMLAEMHLLKTMRDDYTNRVSEIENRIKSRMGEAEVAYLPGEPEPVATWKSQVTRRIDSKRLKSELPEVYEQYSKETTSRVLRVKE
jgi:putative phage-type endonuclease